MLKTSVKIIDLGLFLIALSKIESESLRATAAAEIGKCVQTIFSNRLEGEEAKAEARKMSETIIKCPFYEVTKDDLPSIKAIEIFIEQNFS